MVSLLTCTTSKAMWDRLGVIHEQRSASHKLLLSQRFHEYRMDPKDTVVQHVSEVQNLASQMLDLGENIPDVVVISKILASLPIKYRHFRSAWSSVEPQTDGRVFTGETYRRRGIQGRRGRGIFRPGCDLEDGDETWLLNYT